MKRIVLGFSLIAASLVFLVYTLITDPSFSPWWVNVLILFVWLGATSMGIVSAGKGWESRIPNDS